MSTPKLSDAKKKVLFFTAFELWIDKKGYRNTRDRNVFELAKQFCNQYRHINEGNAKRLTAIFAKYDGNSIRWINPTAEKFYGLTYGTGFTLPATSAKSLADKDGLLQSRWYWSGRTDYKPTEQGWLALPIAIEYMLDTIFEMEVEKAEQEQDRLERQAKADAARQANLEATKDWTPQVGDFVSTLNGNQGFISHIDEDGNITIQVDSRFSSRGTYDRASLKPVENVFIDLETDNTCTISIGNQSVERHFVIILNLEDGSMFFNGQIFPDDKLIKWVLTDVIGDRLYSSKLWEAVQTRRDSL